MISIRLSGFDIQNHLWPFYSSSQAFLIIIPAFCITLLKNKNEGTLVPLRDNYYNFYIITKIFLRLAYRTSKFAISILSFSYKKTKHDSMSESFLIIVFEYVA